MSRQPNTPTFLHATPSFERTHLLTWDDAGNSPKTEYEVQASHGIMEPWFCVALQTGTRYLHRGVLPGMELHYRVRAKRGKHWSAFSPVAAINAAHTLAA
jgi:hypothetical protein